MANKNEKAYFVPIGCSCINQFQLDFRFGKLNYESQLFDWSIVTPDSTIKIIDSKNKPFINSITDLSLHSSKILRSESLPGFYWWHMKRFIKGDLNFSSIQDFEPYFTEFKAKHNYQISKFFNISHDSIVFLWSNLQPNLKFACGSMLDEFILTNSRYRNLKEVVNSAFTNAKIIFLVRPELVESTLVGQKDVIKIDIPYSSDSKGETSLYSVVWNRFI
jgi:hypothetical protein